MRTLIQDVRYALRASAKTPVFTVVAVLTLALGIGANSAIFSVVDAVLLRPLPVRQPDRLVWMTEAQADLPAKADIGVAYPNFFDWRTQNKSFESVSSYREEEFTLTGIGEPAHIQGQIVSSEFFQVMGVSPVFGRGFLRQEEVPGTHVVVLSHASWKSRFGGDPSIVGRPIYLDNRAFTVIGVAPPSFSFPETKPAPELWTSVALDSVSTDSTVPYSAQRGAHMMEVVGRLRPGVTVQQAKAEMDGIARSLAAQFPDSNAKSTAVNIEPLQQHLVGDTRPFLILLLGAVAFVLLIACANIANLLMARAANRRGEIAVRTALGASRGRIIRQLLTESGVLAISGGTVGLLFAYAGLQLVTLDPDLLRNAQEIALNGRVFFFTVVISLLTGVAFGVFPAIQLVKRELVGSLREGGHGATSGTTHARVRDALVIAETALGLMLLVGAGLLIRSLVQLVHVDPGFDTRGVMTMRVDVPSGRYSDIQQLRFYQDLLRRLNTLPGVRASAGVFPLPLSGNAASIGMQLADHPVPRSQRTAVNLLTCSPGVFSTLSIPLVSGRDFTTHDDENSSAVMVVNEAFVRRYYPNENPIGKRVQIGLGSSLYQKGETPWREIVGVVGDIRDRQLASEPKPAAYVPYTQGFFGTLTLLVKTDGNVGAATGVVRSEIASIDRGLPVFDVRPLSSYVAQAVAQPKFFTLLLTIFAALAVVLAAIGIYGVMAYLVAQRTHEIGVRMALGAAPNDVAIMVITKGFRLTCIGLAIGMAAAMIETRFLKTMLYDIQALDVPTFVVVALLLAVVGLFATYLPARRASKVDPMLALRAE